ncbi:MAG TPA: Rid family hydrolase [Gaiellaceae bacterium]|jgi:enamine deaminase RidA (YjgF/YER057c/UK114 family)|nr:Rid family hydrolase [Gaiellaceae bacterium]
MASRETHRTGGFEDVGGYSRAVRSGSYIAVSGTAATDGKGGVVSPGDVHAQTAEGFRRALDAVRALGGSLEDVIRTRIFLVAGSDWRAAVEAHRELFATVNPANTTLFVVGFPPEGVLVEVEVDAILPG